MWYIWNSLRWDERILERDWIVLTWLSLSEPDPVICGTKGRAFVVSHEDELNGDELGSEADDEDEEEEEEESEEEMPDMSDEEEHRENGKLLPWV